MQNFKLDQVNYVELKGLTRSQRFCEQSAQQYRIVQPIKRLGESGQIYDLTRVFLEEVALHPFATHDDLLDAASRIYDIDPIPPMVYEAQSTEPLGLESEGIETVA